MARPNLSKPATKVQNDNDLRNLKDLVDRLQKSAFSWQFDDYFLLRRLLPGLVADKDEREMTEGSG